MKNDRRQDASWTLQRMEDESLSGELARTILAKVHKRTRTRSILSVAAALLILLVPGGFFYRQTVEHWMGPERQKSVVVVPPETGAEGGPEIQLDFNENGTYYAQNKTSELLWESTDEAIETALNERY